MRRIKLIALLLVLSALTLALSTLAPRAAHAQAEPPPQPGARVRAAPPSSALLRHWTTGTLLAAEGDSLVIRPDGGGAPVVLRGASAATLQVSHGRQSRGKVALRNGLLGGLAGLVAGSAVGAVAHRDGDGRGIANTSTEGASLVGSLAGLSGAAIGMATGLLQSGERWRTVTPGAPRADVRVRGDGGVAVGMSVDF